MMIHWVLNTPLHDIRKACLNFKFYFKIRVRVRWFYARNSKPHGFVTVKNVERGIIKTFFLALLLKFDKLDKLNLFSYICSPSVCSFGIASSEFSFFVLSLISILIEGLPSVLVQGILFFIWIKFCNSRRNENYFCTIVLQEL